MLDKNTNIKVNPNYVKSEMIKVGKDAKDISRLLSKSKSTIYRKLKGEIKFTAEEVGKISKYLNVDMNLFYES